MLVGRSTALLLIRRHSQSTVLRIANRTQLNASSTNHTQLAFSRAVLDAEDYSEAFRDIVASELGLQPRLELSFTF